MFSFKASLLRKLLLVTLALCLQGAQAVMVTHVLDPCDLVAEQIKGEGCTQACEQCAPQTSVSEVLAPTAIGVPLLRASHVQPAAPHASPHLPPRYHFQGRAPPR
ncbi:MAG TPA: hypothetical protein VMP00_01600 [Burkholderiales bacterium]|nr:hypothetical protein [Burkholderiales bacterium]